jgi:hypothetical protein
MAQLMTATNVGLQIGKSARTVARLAKDGSLTYSHKLDGDVGAYLFSQEDVDAYLAKHASNEPA